MGVVLLLMDDDQAERIEWQLDQIRKAIFVLVAIVVLLLVLGGGAAAFFMMKKKAAEAPAAPPPTPEDIALLREIRDLLKAQGPAAVDLTEQASRNDA